MTAARGRPGEPIDWDAVHARLAHCCRAVDEATSPTPEQSRAMLETRARTLAQVPPAPPDPDAVLNVVTFSMRDEPYAVETRHVRRVIRIDAGDVTPIPGTPEVLAGVINMEGDILAVFDLARLFGLARASRSGPARIVVLGEHGDEFGLLADDVDEVRTVPTDAVLEPPAALEGIGRAVLRGVTAEALIVLDGAALLRDPRLVIDQGEEPVTQETGEGRR